jgi:hypothetical protein
MSAMMIASVKAINPGSISIDGDSPPAGWRIARFHCANRQRLLIQVNKLPTG